MPMDLFLNLGIGGESHDATHPDEIVVRSFHFAEANKATHASGGGRGSGKVEMQDMVIERDVDKASPLLLLACATGEHIPQGVLAVRRAGGEQQEYMTITLKDILVTSVSTQGARGGDTPTETVTLNFNSVEWEYKPQKEDGTLDAPVKAGYDLAAAQKL